MSNGQLVQLLCLLLLCLMCMPGAAQEPIGPSAACGAGITSRVTCFIDSSGSIAEVQYSNTMRNTPISICNTPDQQLQQLQAQTVELSAADSIVSFEACAGSVGLRGMSFLTALGLRLSCGTPSSSCRSFSSRSTYPLRGFQGSCTAVHTRRQRHEGAVQKRVAAITAACWTPVRSQTARACAPGYGQRGGGQPCQVCPINYYSPGGKSPCLPCPAGRTTLTTGQSQCGCFPGMGVYGREYNAPDICETCPGGTYSLGGSLKVCQPCSTDAFAYLTSAPGSTSIADCTCAAGYGVTVRKPNTCSTCELGYYSEGPQPRAQQVTPAAKAQHHVAAAGRPGHKTAAHAAAAVAHGPNTAPPPAPAPARHAPGNQEQQPPRLPTSKGLLLLETGSGGEGSSPVAAGAQSQSRALQQVVDPVFSTPTYNPCTFCGPGCSTDKTGATSPKQCSCVYIPPAPPAPVPSPVASSPSPSPSPGPSPSPDLSPSPAPSPGPSPSPSLMSYCVDCNIQALTAAMQQQCTVPSSTVNVFDQLNGPCRIVAGDLTPVNLRYVTETSDLFGGNPASGLILCSLVRQVPGAQVTMFISTLDPNPSACFMPSTYPFVVPVISGTQLVRHRGDHTRRRVIKPLG